tara:strand:- start:41 stop:439 length:399 start_codon:yes stop_codon:yes gene_type:complete
MTKHLTLILFIGLTWGQENPDTLTSHNSLHYDNYLIEKENYQQEYQKGVTVAKKNWADSQRFYGILPPTYESLHLMEKNQILVTDSQVSELGFRDGYRKEMAKLKFKGLLLRGGLVGCGCLGIWSWFFQLLL